MENNTTLRLELPGGGGLMAVKSLAMPLHDNAPFWQRFDVIQRYRSLLGWFMASFLLVLATMLFFAIALQQQTTVRVLQKQYTTLHTKRLRLQQQDLPVLQDHVAHLYSTERLEQIAKLYHLTLVNEQQVSTIAYPQPEQMTSFARGGAIPNDTAWKSWTSWLVPGFAHALRTTP